MKTLFVLITLIISVYSLKITCDDENKPTAEGVCAAARYVNDDRNQKVFVVKKECPKGKQCSTGGITPNEDMFHCLDVFKAKDIGEECNFNSDCVTNKCDNKKCVGLKENDACNSNNLCGAGLACTDKADGKGNICKKLAGAQGECAGDDIRCIFGYKCDDMKTPMCQKFGSIVVGSSSDEPLVCESGMTYKKKCVRVKKDGNCKKSGDDFLCKDLELEGIDKIDEIKCKLYGNDKDDESNYVCPYTTTKEKMFLKYLKALNSFKYEDINKDPKSLYDNKNFKYTFGSKKAAKYDNLYFNVETFLVNGLINKDGKIIKECEVNWYLNYLGVTDYAISTTIKFSYLFALIIAALLI